MKSPLATIPIFNRLLVILISIVVDDVEESELIDTLGSGNNSEPISQLLLLEELLCAKEKTISKIH